MENSKYLDLFISEATEHLDGIDNGLVELEREPSNEELLSELLRHTHTLKGIAATMGYGNISNLSHSLESMLGNLKDTHAKGQVGTLFGAVDELRKLIEAVKGGVKDSAQTYPSLVEQLNTEQDRDLFRDLSVIENPSKIKKLGDIRVRTEKLDKMLEITSELMMNKLQIDSWDSLSRTSQNMVLEKISQLVGELQHTVLQLRLTPVAQVFNRFPRMVRDLASKLDKRIDFVVDGADIELDGEILDVIGEPLVHLIRNAADHGIKKEGTISITAKRVKDTVLLEVADTGEGIDWKRLADKSGRKDLKDPRDLLFLGVSTADKVTEISGRGIGMGVVKNALEKIGGHISVLSERGKGTKFTIELPVSIAIIKGLVIIDSGNRYIAPMSSVEKIFNLKNLEVMYQADQAYTIINDVEIPLIELRRLLRNTDYRDNNINTFDDIKTVLVVNNEEILYGFVIDRVLSQQDVVVQPLPDELREIVPFSTATILGDGLPVPIIDFNVII
ncbi:Hpt domain-containing protein [Patescibacteria group bacterium]|nr:Hpt domain-containing protein [Patescibacteria group bacterium]